MSFKGIGKSINPMCSSLTTGDQLSFRFAPGSIVLMSLRPAIPRRVALQCGAIWFMGKTRKELGTIMGRWDPWL